MRVLDRGYVLTDGKNIAEVGEGAFAGEADERIDARGGILLPGFVNTHCHVSMVPFRTTARTGFGASCSRWKTRR